MISKFNHDFPDEFWHAIRKYLLPTIMEGLEICLEAHDLDPVNFDNWNLGTNSYRNILNRLTNLCLDHPIFKGTCRQNAITIEANIGSSPISFTVQRIDPETYIPTSSNRLKKDLLFRRTVQLSLMDDFFERSGQVGKYILGFDVDIIRGVGEIAFCYVIPTGRKQFESSPIAIFNADLEDIKTSAVATSVPTRQRLFSADKVETTQIEVERVKTTAARKAKDDKLRSGEES